MEDLYSQRFGKPKETIEELTELAFQQKGEPIVMGVMSLEGTGAGRAEVMRKLAESGDTFDVLVSDSSRRGNTVPERILIMRGLVKRVVRLDAVHGQLHQINAANLPPRDPDMPIMTTSEALTMKFRRNPETAEDCARFLFYRLQRPIVIGSIGCGKASIERNLLAEGLAKSVVGIDVDAGAESSHEEAEGAFRKISVASSGKSLDQLRKEVCGYVEGCDLVILGDCLHHTNDPYLYVRDCFELLKPGRYIYVSEPFYVPGDERTPNELFVEDKTDFPESMFSLDQHQLWLNWVLLRGGMIVHAQAVPGKIAGDSDAYQRTDPVLSTPVAKMHAGKLDQLSRGTLTNLDDPFNRIRVVLEKGFEHDRVFSVPERFKIEGEGSLERLERDVFDIFPFHFVPEAGRERLRIAFEKAVGKSFVDFFVQIEVSSVRKAFIELLSDPFDDYEAFCISQSPFQSVIEPLYEKFGPNGLRELEIESGEIFVVTKILKLLGIDITSRVTQECPNFRGYTPWDWKKSLYDPYEILVEPRIGFGKLYAHPVPNLEVIGGMINVLIQRENRGVTQPCAYVIPKQNFPNRPLERDEEIFDVWPLNLIRRDHRQILLDKLSKKDGKGFLESRGDEISFDLVWLAVSQGLMVEDLRDPETGVVDREDFYIIYNVMMEDFMPSNAVHPIGGWRKSDGGESVDERMKRAAVIIFMAQLISQKCQLGYLIDLMAKEAGWETVILAAHPEKFKKFPVPVNSL